MEQLRQAWEQFQTWLEGHPELRRPIQFLLGFIGGYMLLGSCLGLLGLISEIGGYVIGFLFRNEFSASFLQHCNDNAAMARECSSIKDKGPISWDQYAQSRHLYVTWEGFGRLLTDFATGSIFLYGATHLKRRSANAASAAPPLASTPAQVVETAKPQPISTGASIGLFVLMTGLFCVLGAGYFVASGWSTVKDKWGGPGGMAVAWVGVKDPTPPTPRVDWDYVRKLQQQLREARDDINRRRIQQEIDDETHPERRGQASAEASVKQLTATQDKLERDTHEVVGDLGIAQILAWIGFPMMVVGALLRKLLR